MKRSTSDRIGAVVLGGDCTALGIVRSLGRHGIPVWVLNDDLSLAGVSRYAQSSRRWPSANETQQIDYLHDLAKRQNLSGWTLFPNSDELAALIARHHADLAQWYYLTTPPWEMMRWAYDKRLTYRLASELGIDYPWTCHPTSREEIDALDCTFPVILKPAIKKGYNRFTSAKAWRINSHQELRIRYDEACRLVEPDVIMVQELIPGGGETQFSYAALCVDGQIRASMVARRTRQYPIDFGHSSTYVETIDQPEIEMPARRILAALRYTGLVELEFKCDPRDGRYKLLDFNARAWTWHALGSRAGVDFPYLVWQLVHREPVPELRARTGVRWVRMVKDLFAVKQAIRKGQFSLHDYLRSLAGPLETAVLAVDDPLPALLEVPLMTYLAGRRMFHNYQLALFSDLRKRIS